MNPRPLGFPHLAHQAASSSTKFGATLGAAVEQALGSRLAGDELTVRDVAARLRVSTATVYALCRRGELGHHRISHAIRVPETAIAELLAVASTIARTGEADRDGGNDGASGS